MRYIMRKLESNRYSLARLIALATSGSGLCLYLNSDKNYKTTLSFSIPALFHDSLTQPCGTMQEILPHISFNSWNSSPSGNVPSLFSRITTDPSKDVGKEESSSEGKGGTKCCSGCLGRDTIANAASKVAPSVVNLSVRQGFGGLNMGKSIGSGTIINSDGTILTCAHVVVGFQGMNSLPKSKIDVALQDGRTFEGTVVNADLQSDIAIVKIKSRTPLPTAKLGSSSKLRPGDWVIAMGCPLSLQNSITAGIVSCVDRKSSDLGLRGVWREYLQSDCAINEGNSGGPLVNIDGEIVGVNIMKVYDADGLGFSVPIDSVSKIIDHFKKSGRVVRPWLGLKMIDLNNMIIAQLKERDVAFPSVTSGVLVPMVTPGSPGERAGFHPSDVIVEFDGKPVESIQESIPNGKLFSSDPRIEVCAHVPSRGTSNNIIS